MLISNVICEQICLNPITMPHKKSCKSDLFGLLYQFLLSHIFHQLVTSEPALLLRQLQFVWPPCIQSHRRGDERNEVLLPNQSQRVRCQLRSLLRLFCYDKPQSCGDGCSTCITGHGPKRLAKHRFDTSKPRYVRGRHLCSAIFVWNKLPCKKRDHKCDLISVIGALGQYNAVPVENST